MQEQLSHPHRGASTVSAVPLHRPDCSRHFSHLPLLLLRHYFLLLLLQQQQQQQQQQEEEEALDHIFL
ncbi:hypothetical protein EPH_0039390 [Eimeria praecox]|uniref:Uncharacterized protein n=1 Tax=Eimeria praecox TaxID=51316 RepID=U6G9D8_9EIME|nr:hypothetical protein EPH_0039390 [Eimeria praecox]